MFTIIGADGREYGPVSADKLRDWIAAGRANAQTRIRREGETEWTTVGALPEFAAGAAASSVPPPAAGAIPIAAPTETVDADTLIARAAPLDISGCLKRGWETGLANYFPLLGVTLLIAICASIASAIPILGILASLLLTGVFYGGLYYYVLKKVRGEPTEIGDAFSGFSVCFGQLALASLVTTILMFLGFLCLIIPGIYLAVAWIFTYLIVREKGLQFWDAMELGRKVVTAQWFRVFGLLLLIGLIACVLSAIPVGMMIMGGVAAERSGGASVALIGMGVLGIIVICLGITPIFMATLMHAYEDLFNPPQPTA